MDLITSALEVCVKIYSLHGTYKSNKNSCKWLTDRVQIIQQTLQKQQDLRAIPVDCVLMLQCLKEDLSVCENVLLKYGFQSKISRFLRGKKHEDRFAEAGKRLFATFDIFCHSLSIQRSVNAEECERRQFESLQEAFDRDALQCHGELESAIETLNSAPSPAHFLQEFGVSPQNLPQVLSNLQLVAQDFSASASSVPSAGFVLTLDFLQRCSWRIRSELLAIEQKPGKKGKMIDVLLGDGTFGYVYAATYCNERVVVKKMKTPKNGAAALTAAGSQALASFHSEVSLACALNHPNIVHTLGGVVDEEEEPPCWIVMELLDQPLPKALDSLTDNDKLRILIGICSALLYMHSKRPDSATPEPYAHRDLKPDNIMLLDGVAKLVDLGLAKMSERSTLGTSVQGTYSWMSPEQALSATSKNYTLCDMFSFGLIAKWLIVGQATDVPFADLPTDQIILEHRRLYEHGSDSSVIHPYVTDLHKVPPVFRALVQGCASVLHSKRWTAAAALSELNAIAAKAFTAVAIAQPAHGGSDAAVDDMEAELEDLVSEMMELKVGLKKACVTFARYFAGEGLMSLDELRSMPAVEAREFLEKSGMKKLQIDKVLGMYSCPSPPPSAPSPISLAPAAAEASPSPAKTAAAVFIYGKPGILKAAQCGDGELVSEHLRSDPGCVDDRNKERYTPLICAAAEGHLHVCRLLIDAKATIDARNSGQHTPLLLSARNGHLDVCRLLINANAAMEAESMHEYTPLMCCSQNGHVDICRVLIGARAKVDSRSSSHSSSLILAAIQGHADVCRLLIASRAEIDAKDADQETPLMASASYGHLEICQLLIEAKADAASKNRDEKTALTLAIERRKDSVAAYLKNVGT